MARRSGLGKGLGALIPQDATIDLRSSLTELPLDSITANSYQPRTHFDQDALSSLTASIRELGVLQPVLVRQTGADRYQLIAGERRLRAARQAGLVNIPAIVRTVEDKGALEQALVENLHREDLNALEEAAAYQQLIEEFKLTHEEVAERVGKSRAAVTNTVRLLQLPATIQKLVADGQLSAGHARALLGTSDRAFQESLARRTVKEGLNVRAVEDAVRTREGVDSKLPSNGRAPNSSSRSTETPPGLVELEELLSDHLSTRVNIEMGTKKSRMIVEFATVEDLERIYRAMTGETVQ